MRVIRTIGLVVLTAVLVAFIAMNWNRAVVNLWPLADGNYLHFEWPTGVIALIFLLIGFVPTWLYFKADRWRLSRRIAALENSLKLTSAQPPIATSTQLEAANEESPAA